MLVIDEHIQSGEAICQKGFVMCFRRVPFACMGSVAAAVQHIGLCKAEETFYKTLGISCRPRLYM